MIDEENNEFIINIKIPNKTFYQNSKPDTSTEKKSGCLLSSKENQEVILNYLSMILSDKL